MFYTVYRLGLHMGENTRWDYRVDIVYKNKLMWELTDAVAKQICKSSRPIEPEEWT